MLYRTKAFINKYSKYLISIAFGVLLYELCEHLPAAGVFLRAFLKAASPVAFGLAAAYVIFIPVSFIETRLFKRLYVKNRSAARAVSMLLTYLAAAGAAGLTLTLVVPRIISAASALAESLEGFASSAKPAAQGGGALRGWLYELASALYQKLESFLPELLPRVISFAVNAMSAAYGVLLSAVISVYAVFKKEKLLSQAQRLLCAVLPEGVCRGFTAVCGRANSVFRKFITGQAASCLFVGGLCYIGMRILSLPYPELISVFICIAALIPVVGPWISTVPSALIILMASGAKPALWFVLMIIAIQLLDDNVLYPRVVGGAVGLSSIWVLAAVLIGGGLFGIGGLFIAVPVTAVLYRIVGDAVNRRAARADS